MLRLGVTAIGSVPKCWQLILDTIAADQYPPRHCMVMLKLSVVAVAAGSLTCGCAAVF